MKERAQITLLVLGLLVLGSLIFCYYELFNTGFTFSSAELEIGGNLVREKLTFVPNKPYHTLYRNFASPILAPESGGSFSEYIRINMVECSHGAPYYMDKDGFFVSSALTDSLAYTEPNEYGCGFGEELGFEKGKSYIVSSEYVLNPTTLYDFKGKHYIKFVAYDRLRHPTLDRGSSLVIQGDAIYEDFTFPGIETIIYIPYEPENLGDYEIITVRRLEFGDRLRLIFMFLVSILPAIACFIVWRLFGKEKEEGDYPSELSQYPKERKAWEVSAYFNPPFGSMDRNFMPAMILDFYSRKLIDLKFTKSGLFGRKEMLIKITDKEIKLDEIEKDMMNLLRLAESIDKPKDGFFSMGRSASGFSSMPIITAYRKLNSKIMKKSKEYLDYKGKTILYLSLFACLIIQMIFGIKEILVYIPPIIAGVVSGTTPLFVRFKEGYYMEYQKWRGFKKYLSNSDSMKISPPGGVVVWEKYLVYATALGVGEKVLKEMKDLDIIDKKEYDNYRFIYTPSAFGAISSSSSGGGSSGGGGMGGGGIGGGGGGGR